MVKKKIGWRLEEDLIDKIVKKSEGDIDNFLSYLIKSETKYNDIDVQVKSMNVKSQNFEDELKKLRINAKKEIELEKICSLKKINKLSKFLKEMLFEEL